MPMPPPKASTEGPRDRQVFHEMGQIVRALEEQGPQTLDELVAAWSGRRTGSAAVSTARSPSRSPTGSSSRTRTTAAGGLTRRSAGAMGTPLGGVRLRPWGCARTGTG